VVVIRPHIARQILGLWDDGLLPEEVASVVGVDPQRVKQFLTRRGKRVQERLYSATTIREMSEGEAGYIAGLIDGEGTVILRWSVSRPRKSGGTAFVSLVTAVRIYNSSEPMIRRVHEICGAGHVHRSPRKGGAWKPEFRFEVSGWKAARMLERALPYLVAKRRHAEIFIEAQELAVKEKGRRTSAGVGHLNELIEELHRLNARGPGNGARTGFQHKERNYAVIHGFLVRHGAVAGI
jgi:hypothetical protein